MPNDGKYKCKWCGTRHSNSEGCPLPKSEPVPPQQVASVTKVVTPVTKVPESVTKPVTKVEGVTKVQKVGRPKLYTSQAERQRAYRARRSSHDHPQ
jgi:hypothetical protein